MGSLRARRPLRGVYTGFAQVLPMVGTSIYARDQRKRHPKGYTSHEVTAARAGRPSGRTQAFPSSVWSAEGRSARYPTPHLRYSKPMEKLGLIAGNGRFPFLLLDAARARNLSVVVAAIKEETDPEIDLRAAHDPHIHVHWLSLGELSRLLETFQKEGVSRAVMAGQVKHKQIFSSIRPDWRLAKLLLSLRTRSTDMLLGAVAKVLGDEGIELISSTAYLEPLLAPPGVLTRRAPTEQEAKDIEYGRTVAKAIAAFDLGQTVVVAAQACIAVEAMEGTDATIARAGALFRTLEPLDSNGEIPTLSRSLTVVKVAKPNQDMRFDVPVIGLPTLEVMAAAGATCLSIESHRTLIFDRESLVDAANIVNISVISSP